MRKSRAVRILVALLMLPILGALGMYVWINRLADRKWAEAEERIRQLSAAFPEGDSRREPEPLTPASKENQIHFVAAIRLAAPRWERLRDAWNLVADSKRGEALDPLLDEAQDFLDRVHEGARRIAASPSDFPPRWHGDWDIGTIQAMMLCGVIRSRRQRDQKAPVDAAETLLDQLQLGRFWAISGARENRGYALTAISAVLDELRDLLSTSELSPEDLRRVERELEPLDAAMQSPLRDLEPILARWGEHLRTLDLQESGMMFGAPYRWRYFLPERLMKAEGFEFGDRQARLLLASESKGYPELLRLSRLADEESERSKNPIVMRGSLLSGIGWSELDRKAQIRLLRAAAHYGATGEVVKLEDPYGTFLHHAAMPTGVKFWSAGDDGVDDGGHVADRRGWRYPPDPDAKDIVIEVPRRP